MKYIILFTFTILIWVNCNDLFSLKNELLRNLDNLANTENRKNINLNSFTPFKWDSLVIVQNGASLEELNKELDFDYPFFEDSAFRLIFIHNNKVIHHEEYYSTLLDIFENRMIFRA